MRLASSLAVFVVGGVSWFPAANAWGPEGHEIVATIAQMYLYPDVLPTLCRILGEPTSKCHLAPIATWADENKAQMLWSAPLHFVGAIDDLPPDACVYPGPNGWAGNEGINILDGIKNVTGLLQDWVKKDANDEIANEALKFLVHFFGDMHQPLHLTGRARGRCQDLHKLWDDLLIAKAVRNVPQNYSKPLPYPQIEGALRGVSYDSFIRRILWEGPLHKWAGEIQGWLSCPTPPIAEAEGVWQKVFSGSRNLYTPSRKKGVEISPDWDVICPYFWSQPLHDLDCDIVWPKELNTAPFNLNSVENVNAEALLLELDTPRYAGVIERRMLLEKSLAQGGIRLAGVLNYLFAGRGSVKSAFVMDPKV